ncbi:SMI1/KNR4 family protein [Streptoalloteichus hindustanus]|uniref:Cell wall assembly regulator SMI1 n=1 Tax=Streptoalloteichus hindustanus TaxID=2017 RepID=A0A1M5KAE8_STRHI|nr:SMI1/KNR4 family protein [Streptoalloteichus hindustanus]SHG49671.1 Cell wall assembly regulator SMI1 [Streptoalloteichus hindustanus]
MGVTESWARLLGWLGEHAPTTYEVIRPGAADADIDALERELEERLPTELREWWRSCDGTEDGVFAELFPPFYTPYSVTGALDSWRSWRKTWRDRWDEPDCDPEAGDAGFSYHPAWVPIAFDGCGDDLVVDLRPGAARGCVLEWDHELCQVLKPEWPSLTAMLDEIVESLETGSRVGHCEPSVTWDGRLDWRIR